MVESLMGISVTATHLVGLHSDPNPTLCNTDGKTSTCTQKLDNVVEANVTPSVLKLFSDESS